MTFNPLLTPDEKTILVKYANGADKFDIAQHFRVTPATLKNRVGKIHEKLGADTMEHAIAIGFCMGILLPADINGFNVRIPRAV